MRAYNIENDLEEWILSFLSKPSKVFNGLPPCPFAKKAWLDKRVIVSDKPWELTDYSPLLRDELDLIILAYEADTPLEKFEYIYNEVNEHLRGKFIVLDDHPKNREEVDGVVLNNGKYAMIFVQAANKLKEARVDLDRLGYYKNFTQEYKDDVTQR